MTPANYDLSSQFLLTLGGILLVGLLFSTISQRSFLPRATLLLIFGAIIGEEIFDLIPAMFTQRFDLIADMTLLMVGFLLGGKLTASSLRDHSVRSFAISLSAALIPACIVGAGMIAMGVTIEIAMLLGCFAAATAPAAIFDVVEESGVKSRFSELLLLIVVLDDVWALLLFGIGIAIVTSINGLGGDSGLTTLIVHELGGAILLGIAIGLPAAYLSGRVKPGKPVLSEALGIVFLCGGLAMWLQVSYLIASIVMGAVIANLARHHEYPFHAIEGIESLFMVVFFVLAGASLEFSALSSIGIIGVVYILCRASGKYLGAWIGGLLSRATLFNRNWMGIALLPQAGVAIGMALVASNRFPEYRQFMLPIVIASTVVFEIVGPVFTRFAIKHTPQNHQ
ncbi:MAG: cation:proton antiporter [Gammaproteobacteria bacterium]|nr:MAG: cation:proton antiporter [Gammaproteobacteria bacterium]